jgi:hypothetical protein
MEAIMKLENQTLGNTLLEKYAENNDRHFENISQYYLKNTYIIIKIIKMHDFIYF